MHADSRADNLSEDDILPDETILYRAFAGTIDGRIPIRAFLWRQDDSWTGSYFYTARRLPLGLQDETPSHPSGNPDGKVVFSESPLIGSQKPTGRWEGAFAEDARSFTGTWSSPDGKTTHPIALRESYEGGILRAVAYRFSSSWTQARNNLEARRENTAVVVQFEGTNQAISRINSAIRACAAQAFSGDSAQAAGASPRSSESAVSREGNPFAALEAAIRVSPIEPDADCFGFPGHDDHELTISPIHNEGGLLSVRVYSHDYTGGAHGNSMDFHLTFETATGRRLDLRRDILRPGYEAPLARAAEAQLRRKWGLKPDASLSDGEGPLDVEQIELNDNWFMTVGGIGFSHDPYEVACYAMGFVDYILPWDALKPWLRKDAPVPPGFGAAPSP